MSVFSNSHDSVHVHNDKNHPNRDIISNRFVMLQTVIRIFNYPCTALTLSLYRLTGLCFSGVRMCIDMAADYLNYLL